MLSYIISNGCDLRNQTSNKQTTLVGVPNPICYMRQGNPYRHEMLYQPLRFGTVDIVASAVDIHCMFAD